MNLKLQILIVLISLCCLSCGTPAVSKVTISVVADNETLIEKRPVEKALVSGEFFKFDQIGRTPGYSFCYVRDVESRRVRIGNGAKSDKHAYYSEIRVEKNDSTEPLILMFGSEVDDKTWAALHSSSVRGIVVGTVTPRLLKELSTLNLDNICITLSGNLAVDSAGQLPTQTKYLVLNPNVTPYSFKGSIMNLSNLVYLDIQGEVVSLSFLKDLEQLVALNVSCRERENSFNTEDVTRMKYLSGFVDSVVVSKFSNLSDLSLTSFSSYSIESLSELNQLERIRIKSFEADLPPEYWPNLKYANLVGLTSSKKNRFDFISSHPKSIIISNRSGYLKYILNNSSQLVLAINSNGSGENRLINIKDKAVLDNLKQLLIVDELESNIFLSDCGPWIALARTIRTPDDSRDHFSFYENGEFKDSSIFYDGFYDFTVVDTRTICLETFVEGCVVLTEESSQNFGKWLLEAGIQAKNVSGCSEHIDRGR